MSLLLSRRIILFIVVLFSTINLFGQATTTATVSATITDVVGAINISNFDFGSFLVKPKAVTKEYSSERIVETLSFTIIGSSYAYSITIPASKIILKRIGGNEAIEANSFIINSPKIINNESNQIIFIRSILKLNTLPVAEYYCSLSSLPITVHYN